MNTKTKALRRNYDRLSDLERFRAALAAQARGDDDEMRTLGKTCPKHTYTMPAWPFYAMPSALLNVMMCATADILGEGMLLAFVYGMNIGGFEDADGELWERCTETARRVLAIWEAIPVFVDEVLSVPVDQVLKTYLPDKSKITFVVEMAHSVLDIEEKTMQAIIRRSTPENEQADLRRERAARLKEYREAAARENAALLRQVWDAGLR